MGQWIRITGALYPLWIKNGMNMNMEQLSLQMMIMHLPESAKCCVWFENVINIRTRALFRRSPAGLSNYMPNRHSLLHTIGFDTYS
jgi:hypothetical protein